jgi:pyridoxine 5-phosphate synthase
MRLGVNIDHIASIRQIRQGIEPEPALAALVCQMAGAESIVVHLREDRRHIQERDLYLLKELVRVKLNLEMSIASDIVAIACKVKPDQATLVPEKRQEMTTEAGLDVDGNLKAIGKVVGKLRNCGIEVSLFIDPDSRQIRAAQKTGAQIIELHTGRYADSANASKKQRHLRQIIEAAQLAKGKGLSVAAGHGLDYYNVTQIAKIKEIEELNIGYSIICRAAIVGLERAVREMKALING